MRIFIAGAPADRVMIGECIAKLPEHGCSGYDWTSRSTGSDHPWCHAARSRIELGRSDALILHVSQAPSLGAVGELIEAHYNDLLIAIWVDVPRLGTRSPLTTRIPAENMWAHFYAAQYPVVESFEQALYELGVGRQDVAV